MVVIAANAGLATPHAVGRGSSSPTPREVGGCGFGGVVTEAFEFCGSRPKRALPRKEPANRPRSTLVLADLAWLSSQPTRGALQPMMMAEALLHRHRARSAAAASKHHDQCFRILWLAARACFASWRTSQPPTVQLRGGGLGVVVFAANAGRTAAHAVGRGSSSPTPRQVGGCGFGDVVTKAFEFCGARPARASPRGEPAGRPQSTCTLGDLAWMSSRPTRDALHLTPSAEALLHRHRDWSAAAALK